MTVLERLGALAPSYYFGAAFILAGLALLVGLIGVNRNRRGKQR